MSNPDPCTQFNPETVVASDFYLDYYEGDDDTHYVIVCSIPYCGEDHAEYDVQDVYLVHNINYSDKPPRCLYEVTELDKEKCDELLDRAHFELQEACDEADRKFKEDRSMQEIFADWSFRHRHA